MNNIYNLSKKDFEDFTTEYVAKTYDKCKPKVRAKQIFSWLYIKKINSINEMSDISKKFREELTTSFEFHMPVVESILESKDGTKKILWKLKDGNFVESVWIPAEDRVTLCISSQVGCQMDCKFCETAKLKFVRNLEPYEIVGQVMQASKICGEVSNIVFMGQGEPFMNITNVKKSVEIMLDQEGLNFSKRKVTISTSGLVEKINEFSKWPLEIRTNLAISLNASNDEVRSEIMPVNKRHNIEELMDTLRNFPIEPHRHLTFEYVMLKGINDSKEDAIRVANLFKNMEVKVNLIPYNAAPGSKFESPERAAVEAFWKFLLSQNINTVIRASRGEDIMAACGQLASTKSK